MQVLILYILKISWRNGCGSIPRRGKENELGYWVFEDFWMIISCHHKHCVFLFLFLHRFSNWINYWWNGICIRSSLLHWTSCSRLKACYRHKVACCALATNNLLKILWFKWNFIFMAFEWWKLHGDFLFEWISDRLLLLHLNIQN